MNRLLTRRRSLQLLAVGGLTTLLPSGLWLTGCGGVSPLIGRLVNLTPTRLAIPVGGYGFIRASTDGAVASENIFRLGITLPPGVEEVNPTISTAFHLNALHATAAAIPGRSLCGLRVKPASDEDGTDQTEPFEIIVIPADQSIGLTIGPYGSNGGPASPGGGTQFAVTATATQRVLPSEWPGAQAQAGFTGEVRFRVEGLPSGIQGGFSRPSVTLGEGLNGDRGEGRTMTAFVQQSGTIYRQVNLVIHRSTAIVAGMTAEILYSDAVNRASFSFIQMGGNPYYQTYKAVSGGALRIEAAPDNRLRIVIDGSLRLLTDGGDATGSFQLRGSMILHLE